MPQEPPRKLRRPGSSAPAPRSARLVAGERGAHGSLSTAAAVTEERRAFGVGVGRLATPGPSSEPGWEIRVNCSQCATDRDS